MLSKTFCVYYPNNDNNDLIVTMCECNKKAVETHVNAWLFFYKEIKQQLKKKEMYFFAEEIFAETSKEKNLNSSSVINALVLKMSN